VAEDCTGEVEGFIKADCADDEGEGFSYGYGDMSMYVVGVEYNQCTLEWEHKTKTQ